MTEATKLTMVPDTYLSLKGKHTTNRFIILPLQGEK